MVLLKKKSSQIGEATRSHIMDVAETLFSENGPGNVSVRDIAERAQVNLGAVNYHFGTKENLFKEVFARAILPLNTERLALLNLAVAGSGDNLRAIVRAFVGPLFELASNSQERARLLVVARYLHEAFASPEGGRALIAEYYEPVRSAFVSALQWTLRDLSAEEVVWRYDAMVGMSIYALGIFERGEARENTVAEAINWSITFLEAGFRAQATEVLA